jgi:UDP-N-acetylglucosamine 2-epimerase
MKIISVAAARPNFMKIAPLMEAFGNEPAAIAAA